MPFMPLNSKLFSETIQIVGPSVRPSVWYLRIYILALHLQVMTISDILVRAKCYLDRMAQFFESSPVQNFLQRGRHYVGEKSDF